MPYSGASDDSLPSNVKKMPTDKKKKWVSIFNNTYNACIKDGGSKESCEGKSFKAANGSVRQGVEMNSREILHSVWDGFLTSLGVSDPDDKYSLVTNTKTARVESVSRSISIERVLAQLYKLLRDREDDDWAYPTGIWIGDDGKSFFSVVAQTGKLYSVPLTVSDGAVSMGDWVEVEEDFKPVTQNRFTVKRQKDGKYRWLCIAGTTVLNRVAQIDSSELFDSFVKRAEKTGKYPRLDFYHWGETDPDVWEFGTADYLAREGVCYIASGLFDEDHPLAKATIRACERDGALWGNSIEFYAYSEPETIVMEPEVRVPVYKDGENTRISVVLEEDAAGLFTRIGVCNEEVKRAMDAKTKEALTALYGSNTDGLNEFLEQFEGEVDAVNQRVKNDKLIHRTTTEDAAEEEAEDQEEEGTEEGSEIVLDDAAISAITQQMVQSAEFQKIAQGIESIQKIVAEMVVAREKDAQEIAELKKQGKRVTQTVEQLSKDEDEKKTEYLQDLPSRRKITVTHRPSDVHSKKDGEEEDESSEDIALRTLNGIPVAY
jgi:hypothetical protein